MECHVVLGAEPPGGVDGNPFPSPAGLVGLNNRVTNVTNVTNVTKGG
jgi:hypothetical protein